MINQTDPIRTNLDDKGPIFYRPKTEIIRVGGFTQHDIIAVGRKLEPKPQRVCIPLAHFIILYEGKYLRRIIMTVLRAMCRCDSCLIDFISNQQHHSNRLFAVQFVDLARPNSKPQFLDAWRWKKAWMDAAWISKIPTRAFLLLRWLAAGKIQEGKRGG